MKTEGKNNAASFALILLGSLVYAFGTVFFVFPPSLLLGGTSGISVIIHSFVPLSSGTLLVILNTALLISAFFVLGKDMAIKTFIGSAATTLLIGGVERLFPDVKIIEDPYICAIIGGAVIAAASGILFYVDSSSGGTDIIALIVRKFSGINIGKALLLTDILIVVIGGIMAGWEIFLSSLLGLLIKTFGIDFVISQIKKIKK